MPKAYIDERTDDVLFARNHFRLLIKTAFVLIALDLLLVGVMFVQRFSVPEQPYFMTTSDGRLIQVYPADEVPEPN